ncbi:MAG: VOC family protein [Chloroflexi bacterium]|nr:VOC family protein [Chloroflexota bacterium]
MELNHIFVPCTDQWRSARFLAGILGVEAGPMWTHFVPVRTTNGVTLDYVMQPEVQPGHYAFLVSDAEFDAAFERLKERDVKFYADFDGAGPGEINHLYGGRGVYFNDPDGHLLELITAPYGPIPERWVPAN